MWDKIEAEISNMNHSIISHIANISTFPVAIYPYIPNTTEAFIKQLANELNLCVNVVYYHCDDSFEASRIDNIPILPFSELMSNESKDRSMVILDDQTNWLLDFWCLEWNGVTRANMLNPYQLDYYMKLLNGDTHTCEENVKEIEENIRSCEKAYELMSDNKSKKLYLRLLANRLTESGFYFDIYTENQYFNKDYIGKLQEEIFFDVGAYDGDTIMKFIDCCPQYKAIYAFEPEKSPFTRLCNNTFELKNVICLNVGMSDKNGEVKFVDKDLGSSHIIDDYFNGDKKNCYSILSVKGDSLNLCPTFIKMDIEGAEVLAITGLSKTIKNYSPKLAICLYHRLSDLWSIPILINSINRRYSFKIAHHSFGQTETVLYAVAKEKTA